MHPLETYIRELHEIRSSGEAVPETSYYGALATLFNEVGKSLKPRVRCIINLRNRGAGIPDAEYVETPPTPPATRPQRSIKPDSFVVLVVGKS